MFGNACFNDAVAGLKNPPNVARSTKNGCCARNEVVDTASVDGDFAIVASSACGLALIYPAPAADLIGLIGIAAVLGWQWFGRDARARAGSSR